MKSSNDSINTIREKTWINNFFSFHAGKSTSKNRNKKIWVFSCWGGNRYSDNSRYLFEYVSKHHNDIKCYWFTKNQYIYKMLKENNLNVVLENTEEAITILKNAGVAFYTNGIDDFGDKPYIYGALIVSLWHGFCLKKIYRAIYNSKNHSKIKKVISDIKWDLFNWTYRDITITGSDYTTTQFKEIFHLKDNHRYLKVGQPRNDAFAVDSKIDDIITNKKVLNLIKNKNIILYLPTYRNWNNKSVETIVNEINNNKEFISYLKNNNLCFVIKLHPLDISKFDELNDDIILLNEKDILDLQLFMKHTFMLISDYSSVAIDYALLKKPILFYLPDKMEYFETQGLYPEFLDIVKDGEANEPAQLISMIKKVNENESFGINQALAINTLYDETNIDVGSYCEELTKRIRGLIDEK